MSETRIGGVALVQSDHATNGKLKAKATTLELVAANAHRVSITICNDGTKTLYVSKGATAVKEEGIRLNKEGGCIVIDDWLGAVSVITEEGEFNVCYSEVS